MKQENLPEYQSSKQPQSDYYELKRKQEKDYDKELCKLFNSNVSVFEEEERGEEMLQAISEYGKLDLPSEFSDFIKKFAGENNVSESEVIKLGLTFLKLAKKIKNQGFGLAVIDDNGNIVSNINY